ncbi:MAG: hypothetical protein COS19_02860 [Flavobacteriaceae bacterium CG02_land_8_20_14_3_00_34_13]|nr:DUF2231 domain-containing protein [Flavobacteriia bacterium]PIV50976.1 MAG: hypothetical protein COS19_02860 [Flavobacteriaceae bacterium CG02_land_8_20_14_3_00_34_13]PIZ07434.1 MAG: hypothetical protein COY56_09030 [Flavobacteriaceae bacterium CG_4_10_14_0_8_um_filter_34_31]PJC08136.1 MAG: hypothetical protein CO068_02495 [Flavobacteriaceae bacterium CG_4_9_14_0_8_um_filter_34_30]
MTTTHLHAMLIHFPIALLLVGFLSEIIALLSKNKFYKDVAFYLLLLGALGAIVAYISGSYAGEGMEEGMLEIPMELHEEAALITLWLSIITALYSVGIYYFKYQRNWTKWIGLLLFTVLVVSVARTGYLGGQLVFKHGAGIELALPEFETKPAD